jgi:hypothetical protein
MLPYLLLLRMITRLGLYHYWSLKLICKCYILHPFNALDFKGVLTFSTDPKKFNTQKQTSKDSSIRGQY